MSALLLGMVFGLALFALFRAFASPAPVSLAEGLAALHSDRRIEVEAAPKTFERGTTAALRSPWVDRLVAPMKADVGVCGMTDAGFVSDFVGRFAAGMLVGGAGIYGANRIIEVSLPVATGIVLVAGAVGAVSSVLDVREKAKHRRREFLEAMVAFIEFVRLGTTFRPLEGAAAAGVKVGDGWPFEVLAAAMEDSHRYGEPMWIGLARLGRQYGLPDLEELANTLALGQAEGASLSATLAARSRALRVRLLSNELAEANKATETLQAPVTMVAVLFFFFLAFPAAMVLTGNG